MANKKAGIEEVIDTVEHTDNQHSPQTGNFEIKRRSSASTSDNCSYPKDSIPPCDIDDTNQHVELTSTPISGSTMKCDSEIMLTPTRPSRSVKRSQTTDTRKTQRQSQSRKRSRAAGQQNGETKKSKQSNNKDNDASTNDSNINSSHGTPCSSESEDDLPAVSISQTPIKGFSSCRLCFAPCMLICIFG